MFPSEIVLHDIKQTSHRGKEKNLKICSQLKNGENFKLYSISMKLPKNFNEMRNHLVSQGKFVNCHPFQPIHG